MIRAYVRTERETRACFNFMLIGRCSSEHPPPIQPARPSVRPAVTLVRSHGPCSPPVRPRVGDFGNPCVYLGRGSCASPCIAWAVFRTPMTYTKVTRGERPPVTWVVVARGNPSTTRSPWYLYDKDRHRALWTACAAARSAAGATQVRSPSSAQCQ